MKPSEYQRIKIKIETTYQEELKALNLLWKKYGEPSQKNGNERTDVGSIKDLITEAIAAQSGEFAINDLEGWIQAKNPAMAIKRATIRVILNRLTGKKIEVVRAGQGRSANVYKTK